MPTITANTGSSLTWSSGSSWVGGNPPDSSSDVVIPSGSQVVMNGSESSSPLTITVQGGGELKCDNTSAFWTSMMLCPSARASLAACLSRTDSLPIVKRISLMAVRE